MRLSLSLAFMHLRRELHARLSQQVQSATGDTLGSVIDQGRIVDYDLYAPLVVQLALQQVRKYPNLRCILQECAELPQ